jgi:hypothetical protein
LARISRYNNTILRTVLKYVCTLIERYITGYIVQQYTTFVLKVQGRSPWPNQTGHSLLCLLYRYLVCGFGSLGVGWYLCPCLVRWTCSSCKYGYICNQNCPHLNVKLDFVLKEAPWMELISIKELNWLYILFVSGWKLYKLHSCKKCICIDTCTNFSVRAWTGVYNSIKFIINCIFFKQIRTWIVLAWILKTVALIWVWPKVVWVERPKICRRRITDGFEIFLLCLRFLLNLIKSPCFKEIDRNCLKYLDIRWAILADDLVRNAPIRFLLLFGHFPKCICYYVSAAEKVSNTLWVFPNESPKPLRYYSNDLQELLDTVPNMSWHKFRNFFYISLKVACFLFIKIKNWRRNRKI